LEVSLWCNGGDLNHWSHEEHRIPVSFDAFAWPMDKYELVIVDADDAEAARRADRDGDPIPHVRSPAFPPPLAKRLVGAPLG
jgi:endogenous inhibitor of DNA gyrase (YacG/DUF329 family)